MLKEYITKISKGTIWILGLNAVNYLSSFILAILISRFLGVEGLGEYGLIFAFVAILGIVSDFGLSILLIRKINENKFRAKDLIFNFNIIKIILSFSLIIILFLLSLLFLKKILYPAFFIGVALIIPRALQSTYDSSLRSFLNQTYTTIFRSINSLLQLGFSYFLLLKGSGLVNIFICILMLDILTLIVMNIANNKVIQNYISNSKENITMIRKVNFKDIFITTIKESSVFFLNNFMMISIKGLNVIMLGYFSTVVSVGIYSAGSKFVNGAGIFSGALFNSFYPAISSIKNDLKLKIGIAKKLLFYSFTFGLIISALIFFLSEFLINLTFKINEAVIVLKILSFTIIPVLVYTITQSFLFSVYSEKFLMKILIIAWSLNIILSIILIILYDYIGCAVALTTTEIFLMMAQLNKFNYDNKKFEIQKVTLT